MNALHTICTMEAMYLGVLSKKNMGKSIGENMDAGNNFAVLTAIAFLATLPVRRTAQSWQGLPPRTRRH